MQNSGPPHMLIMPTTNMVMSWRTASCAAESGKNTYLKLVQCPNLAENMYELVPSHAETPFRMVVVKNARDLDASSDFKEEEPHLILYIKAYLDAASQKVKLKCFARQPSVGWYHFTVTVKKTGGNCKPAHSIKSKIQEKKDRSESKKRKSLVDTTRMYKITNRPSNADTFKADLDCLLRIPKDLSVLESKEGELSMYDKMLIIEGEAPKFVSRKTYDDIWLTKDDTDVEKFDAQETDEAYSELLWDLDEHPDRTANVYKIAKENRQIQEQIEAGVRGLEYDEAGREQIIKDLSTVKTPITGITTVPIQISRMIKIPGLVKKKKKTVAGGEDEEEVMDEGVAGDPSRTLSMKEYGIYSLLVKRLIGTGLRHELYREIPQDSSYLQNMAVADNCINSLYLLPTEQAIRAKFNKFMTKGFKTLATECKPNDVAKELYNKLLPCGKLVKNTPKLDLVVSLLRSANPDRVAKKIKLRNFITKTVEGFVKEYKGAPPWFIAAIYQLGFDVLGLSESVPENKIMDYFETELEALQGDERFEQEVQEGIQNDEEVQESVQNEEEVQEDVRNEEEVQEDVRNEEEVQEEIQEEIQEESADVRSPSEDVLRFFGREGLVRNSQWREMPPTAQLECVIPIVECLWEWIPQRADVVMGKYAWVHYKRVGNGELSTVVWQQRTGASAVMQNQCRLLAAAFKVGPFIHNAFALDLFEGFQTSFSLPAQTEYDEEIAIDAQTVLHAVAHLTQSGQTLPFQFKVPKSVAGVGEYGTRPSDAGVWRVETLSNDACAVGRRAWAAYLQAAVDNNCKLSATDLANILKMSVPFATNVQKYDIEREVGEWPTEDCQQPQILLNDWVNPQKFKWQRFKFLACGAYGCSSLWQYKTSSTSRGVPTVEVRKRVLAHTSKYFKQGKIRFEDMWFETPLREFAMLQAFYKARLAVKPLDEPKRTDESREMLLIKEHVEYYSPVGEQYWT